MKFEPYFFRPINADGTFAPGMPVRGFPEQTKSQEIVVASPHFSEEDMKTAEKDAHQQGYLKGMEDGYARGQAEHAQADREIVDIVSKLAEQVQQVLHDYQYFVEVQRHELPKLALAIAKKVAGAALTNDPTPAIEEMTRRCLELAAGEPKIVVTVHESLASTIETRLIDAFASSEETGEIIISPSADIAREDCKIQWKHGSAERSSTELWYEVDAIISTVAREKEL